MWRSLPFRIRALLVSAIVIVAVSAAFRAEMSGQGKRTTSDDVGIEASTSAFGFRKPQVSPRLARFVDSFVKVGTSTLISEDAPVPRVNSIASSTAVASDTVTAEAYLVGNLQTGEIYSYLNPDHSYAIASISKLVTVLVARDALKSDQPILITPSMLEPYGEEGGLRLGDTLTAHELTYPLILESSNDAAEALAEAAGRDVFIKSMNDLVEGLGMKKTHFDEPSGLSPGDVSSARDLFKFARHLYHDEPSILELTRLPSYAFATTSIAIAPGTLSTTSTATSTERGAYAFKNTNPFVGDPHYIGGKTGRTNAALESMLSMFRYEIHGRLYPIAIVVLRSQIGNRQYDSSTLYSRLMNKLESKPVSRDN